MKKGNPMSENKSCAFRTSIGGQALIEGVMMRGPEKQAIVVRDQEGNLVEKVEDLKFIKDEISDLERREREARIEALRRSNLLGDEDDDETGVVLLPPRREVDSDG
jgi:hypothetical protein